jgi:DNA polymerase-3 subunit epsilon
LKERTPAEQCQFQFELQLQVRKQPTAEVMVFDVETTGTDRRRDQVIELCMQFGLADDAPKRTWRFLPEVPIHPGAQAVHGIAIEDLDDCPPFASAAEEIAAIFARAEVIVGYNLAFDIDMLQAEYERLRLPMLDLSGKKIVDPFRLWQQCEPRSLQHAHQRFVGERFAAAHTASADVAATGRVLQGMLRHFGLDGRDWTDIAGVCDPQGRSQAAWIGGTRHFQWDAGAVVVGFGKHAGKPLHVLARTEDATYLRWMIEKDFPSHVQDLCQQALDLPAEDFLAWARARFLGDPARAGGASAGSSGSSDEMPAAAAAAG